MSELLYDFLKSLLDPERNGWAVTQEVRDEARMLLRRFPNVGRETEGKQSGGECSGVGQETRCPLLHQASGNGEQEPTRQAVLYARGHSFPGRVQEAGGEADEAPGVHPC